jgi:HSP20 family molecular chaperone IbpA
MNGNPVDLFEEMDEMFARLFSRVGREFMAGSPQAYGYRIGIRDEGEETEPDGKERMADNAASPLSTVTVRPVTEVHRIGNEVKVIADLHGISGEILRLDMRGNTLIIDGGDADYHYHTSVVLPPVEAISMQKTLKNGILEVTFRRLPGCVGPDETGNT